MQSILYGKNVFPRHRFDRETYPIILEIVGALIWSAADQPKQTDQTGFTYPIDWDRTSEDHLPPHLTFIIVSSDLLHSILYGSERLKRAAGTWQHQHVYAYYELGDLCNHFWHRPLIALLQLSRIALILLTNQILVKEVLYL